MTDEEVNPTTTDAGNPVASIDKRTGDEIEAAMRKQAT